MMKELDIPKHINFVDCKKRKIYSMQINDTNVLNTIKSNIQNVPSSPSNNVSFNQAAKFNK